MSVMSVCLSVSAGLFKFMVARVCARVCVSWMIMFATAGDYTAAKCKACILKTAHVRWQMAAAEDGATLADTIAVVKPPAASQGQFSSDARARLPVVRMAAKASLNGT